MAETTARRKVEIPADSAMRKHRSLTADAWRRLISLNTARLGMVIIGLLLLVSILAPIVHDYNPKTDSNLRARLQPPSREHLLGADNLGRDVLVRLIHGARYSLGVGIISVGIGLTIGGTLGMLAGFLGGATDKIIMRFMDIILAFPAMLLAIAIVAVRGPGLNNTMVAVGVVFIPIFARLTRSMVLSVREHEYVIAATCAGATRLRILSRHILPNILSPIIVQSTLGLASAILSAAGLGFLGLGQQPPKPEWGAMLSDSYKFLARGAWWVIVSPGVAIMLSVLGFNLLGDGLRDALDPRLQE
ncbi:MAG: putative D,D-dipeptide transport system permease protein DdpC [Anaerolineales bacterium]|nr:putative D,D-dipeptide transport system permease protein DdpC [Anaerolineales bacterium]